MVTLPTKVLLATDGSEDAAAASRAAADLSKRLDAELYVIHAWKKPHEYAYPDITQPIDAASYFQRHAEETLRRERERLERMGAKIAESYLELGRPADPIFNLSGQLEVGLIVMGSRGHGAF